MFESDKFLLTKNGVYVGKGYVDKDMFKLCVMALKPNKNDNEINNPYTYLLKSSNIWHARLVHVNFDIL